LRWVPCAAVLLQLFRRTAQEAVRVCRRPVANTISSTLVKLLGDAKISEA